MTTIITNNINNKKENKVLVPHQSNWIHYDEARSIIHDELNDKNKEQCIDLIKKMLASTVRTNICGGDYIENTSMTVIQWNDDIPRNSLSSIKDLIELNSINHNDSLVKWQKELLIAFKNHPKTISIFVFQKHHQDHIWILAKEPSTDDVFEYSKEYVNVMSKIPDIYCDFMVFGEKELEYYDIPVDSMKF